MIDFKALLCGGHALPACDWISHVTESLISCMSCSLLKGEGIASHVTVEPAV